MINPTMVVRLKFRSLNKCLVLMTTWGGNTYDWNSPVIIGLIIGALVAGGLFVMVQRRATEPVMPLHLASCCRSTIQAWQRIGMQWTRP